MKQKSILKKIWNIVSNLILYLFLAVCVLALVLTVLSKRDIDGAATLFGYQLRVVTSDSMAQNDQTDVSAYEIGSIPLRSMIFVECVPEDEGAADEWYAGLKVGDVLTFRYVYTGQVTITHRVVSIEQKENGGYLIELAGDNKNSETGQLVQVIDTSEPESPNYIIGKVVGQSYPLGYLISLLQEPLGMVLIVIVPCFLVILYEVIKITSIVTASKKERKKTEEAQKDNELEELRRKLAELEAKGADTAAQETEVLECPVSGAAEQDEPTQEGLAPTENETEDVSAEPVEADDAKAWENSAEASAQEIAENVLRSASELTAEPEVSQQGEETASLTTEKETNGQ